MSDMYMKPEQFPLKGVLPELEIKLGGGEYNILPPSKPEEFDIDELGGMSPPYILIDVSERKPVYLPVDLLPIDSTDHLLFDQGRPDPVVQGKRWWWEVVFIPRCATTLLSGLDYTREMEIEPLPLGKKKTADGLKRTQPMPVTYVQTPVVLLMLPIVFVPVVAVQPIIVKTLAVKPAQFVRT